MEQWQGFQDPASGSRRYNGNQMTPSREYGQQQGSQVQPPVSFKYDQYQGSINSHSHSSQHGTTSPIATPQIRDGNGDVPMQDAHDPYNGGTKYPLRPHHQSHISSGRSTNLHSPPEPSAAAQRYSPMEVMSPTSPYGSKNQPQGQFSAPHSQRQSPTRGDYTTQSPYYSRQNSQLPPITPYTNSGDSYPSSAVTPLDGAYSNDSKSPRRPFQPANSNTEKRPVPQFKKTANVADLRPKVNPQPPFRRANPEGGFISVCSHVLEMASVYQARLIICVIASASSHRPSTRNLPYLQSQFQI